MLKKHCLELDWKNTSDGEKSVFLQRIFNHIHILLNIKLHVYLSLLYS